MQLSLSIPKFRPVIGLAALCVVAAAAYFVMLPDKPLVLAPAALASVAQADSFKRIAGSGTRALHVFISVDCSFCRQLEPQLGQLEDVTVHYHLLPGHGASGRQDALHVWCAADQAKAWAAAARGGTVAASTCDGAGLDRNRALALELGIDRTPAIIFSDGVVLTGAVGTEALDRALASSRAGQ